MGTNKLVLKGGIGNQLFQFAYAFAVQQINHSPIVVSVASYKKDPSNRQPDILRLPFANKLKATNRRFCISRFFWASLRRFGLDVRSHYSRDGYTLADKAGNSVYIDGYFQDWSLFNRCKQELLEAIQPTESIRAELDAFFLPYKDKPKICLHIRRGDYITKYASIFEVCTPEYYEKAMKLMDRKFAGNEIFFLFTNTREDYELLKEELAFLQQYKVQPVFLSSDLTTLFAMSNCEAFVMSNSSFSWWGQYLANAKGENVVAPNLWAKDGSDFSKIYMPDWTILQV